MKPKPIPFLALAFSALTVLPAAQVESPVPDGVTTPRDAPRVATGPEGRKIELPAPGKDAPTAWQAATATAPDSTEVPLLLATPEGAGPFPVVVYVHGAPGGVGEAGLHRISRQSRWARFVEVGYAVCLADYRGHPENDPFAVLRGPVTAADDLAAVISHLGTLPSIDTSRLALIGQSLGGAASLAGASNGKLKPACLVVSAPASFAFIGIRGRPDRSKTELTGSDYDRAGTVERAYRIDCPVLIVQGTADSLAPLNLALAAAFRDAGKEVRLELFEGQGHGFTNGPDNEPYHRAVELMLDFIGPHTRMSPHRRTGYR